MNKHRYVVVFFVVLSISIFLLQSNNIGFENGHHGWVSSNTLAIIDKATYENGFVGYSRGIVDQDGQKEYVYFDRYPFFFSASIKLLWSIFNLDLSSKIYWTRQFMNIFFVLCIVLTFLITNILIQDQIKSLTVTILSYSGYFWIYYKDMVHFDQPAVFGFLLTLYSVFRYRLMDGSKWQVLICSLIGVSLGRGYATYAILGLWIIFEIFEMLVGFSWRNWKNIILFILKLDSVKISLVCFVFSAAMLGYNVSMEAETRGVAIRDTSIVQSAIKRLGFDHKVFERYKADLKWNRFTAEQIRRFFLGILPYSLNKHQFQQMNLLQSIFLFLVFLLLIYYVFRAKDLKPKRNFYFLLLSGFMWTIPMRHLTAFHDYTAIYNVGLYVIFFLALTNIIPKRLNYIMMIVSIIVFYSSLISVKNHHDKVGRELNVITLDFERIDEALGEIPQNIFYKHDFLKGIATNSPHTMGFYVGKHWKSDVSFADYLLSRNSNLSFKKINLGNRKIFLYKITRYKWKCL